MNYTRDEILAELDEYLQVYPDKKETDIIADDIIASKGISHSSAIVVMKKVARTNPDKYELLKVKSSSSGWRWALRRK